MFPWNRPTAHTDFGVDAAKLLTDLRQDITNGKGISFANREIWNASWSRRNQTPGLHKAQMVGADPVKTKCVYCEQYRPWKRELNVEHYRPKAKVTHWDGDPGFLVKEPPKEVDVSATGYYWLAFAWGNYSLACITCNQTWKRNLFPVKAPRPACIEGVELLETPLLLEPGVPFQPRDHFAFDEFGYIHPNSERGEATIITCGLNRPDLVAVRLKTANDVQEQLNAFWKARIVGDQAAADRAYTKLGTWEARDAEFTSLVRSLVEQAFDGCLWEELEGMPD